MVQLKLMLNSKKPSVVYAANGKSYTLKPGSNTLNLEYEDYVALAKALGITPIENKKDEPKEAENPNDLKADENSPKPDVENQPTESTDDNKDETDHTKSVEDALVDESTEAPNNSEEHSESENPAEAPIEEPTNDTLADSEDEYAEAPVEEPVNYAAMSYTELKAAYKELTGKSCKLKKDDLIAYLQEHANAGQS